MKKKIQIFISALFCMFNLNAQNDTIFLSLSNAISLAQDSSLSAFKNKFSYESDFYVYQDYRLGRLPVLKLTTSPFTYNQAISKQWNSATSSYYYYEEQYLNSSFVLNLQQNITATGGKIYLQSDLGRLENYSNSKSILYSSTPAKIGINQPLFSFNSYRWEKRIEPLKYQIAKLEYVQSAEEIALETLDLYFNLVSDEQKLKIAAINSANADTLYHIGLKRQAILAINRADVLTLKLDMINAINNLKEAKLNYNQSVYKLNSYLYLPQTTICKTILPDSLLLSEIDVLTAIELTRNNNPFYLSVKQQTLESERDVEKSKIESRFSSNLDMSFGLNQRNENLSNAYNNLLNQQKIDLSLQIPILDWGQRRNAYRLAKTKQNIQLTNLKQSEADFEQAMQSTIYEFNFQKDLIISAKEASVIAVELCEMNKQRFLLGQIDVNALSNLLSRKENATNLYITVLQKYWQLYFKIRKLTLYNFEEKKRLVDKL